MTSLFAVSGKLRSMILPDIVDTATVGIESADYQHYSSQEQHVRATGLRVGRRKGGQEKQRPPESKYNACQLENARG